MKIAIVGCGQLGRMLAEAAISLGHKLSFLADIGEQTRCVEEYGKVVRYVPGSSVGNIYDMLGRPDVVTIEKENVSVALLKALKSYCAVYPNPDAVYVSQNRIREKNFLNNRGLPVAPYSVLNSSRDLSESIRSFRFPVFIKHAEMGYDGKNQWKIKDHQALKKISEEYSGTPLVMEQGVEYLYEASLIAVRSVDGDIRCYPLTQNQHSDGILIGSFVSEQASNTEHLLPACHYIEILLKTWDYVGVLTVELFITDTGVLINEIAPRVHNSGHWTQTAHLCSQFENHIRAITGSKLGETNLKGSAGMVNLLGVNDLPVGLKSTHQVYLYPKALKPGRKMGHVNIVSGSSVEILNQMETLSELLYGVVPSARISEEDRYPISQES